MSQPQDAAWIRPVQGSDLPELQRLAGQAGVGLTTLPQNENLLAEHIELSCQSLSQELTEPGGQSYLFVLDNGERLLGCSAIVAAVGSDQAFYNYHVGQTVFASRELEVYRRVPTLYLSNDLTGSSELATLFVDPAARAGGWGRLLSWSRFLFIGAHSQGFSGRLIAEMRGYADGDGRSPFWESLGRHFFAMDFSRADRLSGAETRSFIAELMPRHPVYTVLLSAEAQQAIAQVHPQTRAARRLLEAQGFRYRNYIDIFDAGPVLEADTRELRCIREQGEAEAVPLAKGRAIGPWRELLVSNQQRQSYRALRVTAQQAGDRIALQADDLARLKPCGPINYLDLGPGSA